MTTLFYMLLILAPMAILGTAFYVVRKKSQGRPVKRAVGMNLAVFAVLVVLMSVLCFNVFAADDAQPADAAAQTEQTAEAPTDSSKGLGLLAAGLVTGLAGIGGGIAVAAIAATAENPKSFGKSIIFVALGESIALYGVVISILILNKV